MRFFHPRRYLRVLVALCNDYWCYHLLPDKMYLRMRYKSVFGEKMNFFNPKTFNQKINWLKVYDRNPVFSLYADKYEVKKIIANIIGDEYVIPTLGIYDSFDDIDFRSLPQRFVIKCTHDAASTMVCKNKDFFNREYAKQFYREHLAVNYYYYRNKQWVYKNIKPRIIVETFISDDDNFNLKDYKFFCFNGVVKFFKIDVDRSFNHKAVYFDMNWNRLEGGELDFIPEKNETINLSVPDNFEKMVELVTCIAKYIDNPFVRIDMYNTGKQILFGEVTFYPAGGMGKFYPQELDRYFGNFMDLSNAYCYRSAK